MKAAALSPVRKAPLLARPEFDACLVYYPAGFEQTEHDHPHSQFSMVLTGSLLERVDGCEYSAGPGQFSAKPRGVAHADSYGPTGALLLSFNFRCEETACEVLGKTDWHWRLPRRDRRTPALERGCPTGEQGDLLWDVLSVSEPRTARGQPPEWLRWARSELDCGDSHYDIAELAEQAGVHRVHFSRQFVRHFGLPPSRYRQRQMAGRAVRAMLDGKLAGAAAAQDAGFADQSHMNRAIRSAFGTTPRRIAALLAGQA